MADLVWILMLGIFLCPVRDASADSNAANECKRELGEFIEIEFTCHIYIANSLHCSINVCLLEPFLKA